MTALLPGLVDQRAINPGIGGWALPHCRRLAERRPGHLIVGTT
jgi:hypothetical protein